MKPKIFDGKILAIILAVVAFSIISVTLLQDETEAENSAIDDIPLKAVIIDQLYETIPNEAFHEKATEFLEEAGFKVDIFTTKQITIDLYKNLPSMNYEFIVIRTHGLGEKYLDGPVMLFTGERYSEEKYITEQLSGQVQKGSPLVFLDFQPQDSSAWTVVNETYRILSSPVNTVVNSEDEYFVIPPKFIDEAMVGKFPKTTFLLGGCNTMSNPSMAQSLINRGASSVIGWDNTVGSYDNDVMMLWLLEDILINQMDPQDAIDKSMEKRPPESLSFPAGLKYYSEEDV